MAKISNNNQIYIIAAVVVVVLLIIWAVSESQKTKRIEREMQLQQMNQQYSNPNAQGWVNALTGFGTALGGIFGGKDNKDDKTDEELTEEQKESLQNAYNFSQTGLWNF